MENNVDIKENHIAQIDSQLLNILLQDKSSHRNIIWATDNYADRGELYQSQQPILADLITHYNGNVIKPRTTKSKREQAVRVRQKAEVFTPSWICNSQNNLVDAAWFGRNNVFNIENGQTWITVQDIITFPDGKTWKDYVLAKRLEISCGEAPYLASRYDTVTGEWIDVGRRIGLLDRKLRVVNENTHSEQEWVEWAVKAFQSVYGFEWQGDSLLIARENLLFTFIDYYTNRFAVSPIKEHLIRIAKILAWNVWQMDGLKGVIPNSCTPSGAVQMSIDDTNISEETHCPGCLKGDIHKHIGTYCRIMDWSHEHSVRFIDLMKGECSNGKV